MKTKASIVRTKARIKQTRLTKEVRTMVRIKVGTKAMTKEMRINSDVRKEKGDQVLTGGI